MPESAIVVEAQPAETQTNPLVLIRTAIERGISPEQMGKLLDLQERFERNHANLMYNQAMARCQSTMPVVVKDKLNSHSGKKYASLETVLTRIQPTYSREGFSLSFLEEPGAPPNHTRLCCDVSHVDGCTRRYWADIPNDQGNKQMSTIQAKASTLSYGKRYLVCMVFNVNVADEDRDGQQANGCLNDKQITEINELVRLCSESGRPVDAQKFLAWLKVDVLDDVPAGRYREICDYLRRKARSEQ